MELYDVKKAIEDGQRFFVFDYDAVKEIRFRNFSVTLNGSKTEDRCYVNIIADMANEEHGSSVVHLETTGRTDSRPIFTSAEGCCNDSEKERVRVYKAITPFVIRVMSERGYEIVTTENGCRTPVGYVWNGRKAVPLYLYVTVNVLTHEISLSNNADKIYKTAEECRNDNKPKIYYLK